MSSVSTLSNQSSHRFKRNLTMLKQRKVVFGEKPSDITASSVMVEKEGLAFNILDLNNDQTPGLQSEN